ncbi:MAG: type I restriction enzyme HsdR N-terminal domain-containing protein [Deltaproteobacteria bacterium]|nr:type I restriction enzyme HsdR N-terminal domain-containing protein [Deltaproteobacteria bacterium]
METIIDFVTGASMPLVGAEANRQATEKILVNEKGYSKENIAVDVDLELTIAGQPYQAQIDLVVSVAGKRVMVVKCVAGSLGSREREVVAAARLLDAYQIPFAVATDGKSAVTLDTVSGRKMGEGIQSIPSRQVILDRFDSISWSPYPEQRLEREKLIFRTYDLGNVNVQRSL